MAHNEKSVIDPNATYEKNAIQLGGIFWFTLGMAVLSILSFALMWVFMGQLEEGKAAQDKQNASPMSMDSKDKLPPEPRLQAAPGFGVDGPNGRVNLELMAPQSEYRSLQKQWDEQLKSGQKDPKTGTVITMPIEEAKKKLLEQGVKTSEGVDKALEEANSVVSYSSAGRKASDKRR